jgi:uncharacterized membrane protein
LREPKLSATISGTSAVHDFSTFPRHRIDGLVDAVLAITLTLLVLELRLPEEIGENLFGTIYDLRPQFISWIVSFLILALCWNGHVRAFQHVEKIDGGLFWLVVLWLLLTSVVPFSSSLIGEHNDLFQSHVIYAANIIAIEAAVILRNLHLRRHPELLPGQIDEWHRLGWMGAGIVTVCALATVALAAVRPDYASIAYVLIWPLTVIARRAGKDD